MFERFYSNRLIGPVGRVFTNDPRDLGSYQRLLKWYLIPPCLTLSNIRYVSRVKWNTPGKGVAPSPTPRCSSYWKGSLLVTLDYGRQFYLLTIWPIDRTLIGTSYSGQSGPGSHGNEVVLCRFMPGHLLKHRTAEMEILNWKKKCTLQIAKFVRPSKICVKCIIIVNTLADPTL